MSGLYIRNMYWSLSYRCTSASGGVPCMHSLARQIVLHQPLSWFTCRWAVITSYQTMYSWQIYGTTAIKCRCVIVWKAIMTWSGLPDFLALLYNVFRCCIDFTRFLFNQGKLQRRGGSTFFGNAFLHNWQKDALPFHSTIVNIIWCLQLLNT